jgi:hypothetical protein
MIKEIYYNKTNSLVSELKQTNIKFLNDVSIMFQGFVPKHKVVSNKIIIVNFSDLVGGVLVPEYYNAKYQLNEIYKVLLNTNKNKLSDLPKALYKIINDGCITYTTTVRGFVYKHKIVLNEDVKKYIISNI